MYEFLDRLITIAMPRIRDFRGVSAKSFDGRGNYAMGLKEQIIFPEINYDRIDPVRGMDVIVTTSAGSDDEARQLLRLFGFPFTIAATVDSTEKDAPSSYGLSPFTITMELELQSWRNIGRDHFRTIVTNCHLVNTLLHE